MLKNKGITLISLVITIIILLILASISIGLLTGNNGLLARAKQAKKNTLDAENLENSILKGYENEIKDDDRTKTELEKLKEKYVQDGLVVWYDGKYNAGETHDDATTTWKNLVSVDTEKDGTLMNITNTVNSGWKENSLILDGVDDWVKMSYIYNENMTIEIVEKDLSQNGKIQKYISSQEAGGIGIAKTSDNIIKSQVYMNGSYSNNLSDVQGEIGKIYSLSTRVNSEKQYLRVNDKRVEQNSTSVMGKPASNTVFAIGTNPQGNISDLSEDETNAKIEVYSVRIYNRCLTEEEIQKNYDTDKERYEINKEKITAQSLGYATNGLLCLYDGINNTQYGHCENINKWIDLSNNNNDGTISGINYTETSGWDNNSLNLDGSNDYVKMSYMHDSNITVEIVCKQLIKNETSGIYIANAETGGAVIMKNKTNQNEGQLYIAGANNKMQGSEVDTNKIYSLSVGYNGAKQFLKENDKINYIDITGTYKAPNSSTVFMLGTNPSGTSPGTAKNKMKAYSVRIYNRALTEDELKNNYEIDKSRFSIM